MAILNLSVNGYSYEVDVDETMPLLWVLRDYLGLNGTKYGCGIMQCGSCTVHADGEPIFSCSTPVAAVKERRITTIEGLDAEGKHPLQTAWIDEQVPQCGYCQSGQIMRAASLLSKNSDPSDDEIDETMKLHICRCGTYDRIRKAIKRAATNSKQIG